MSESFAIRMPPDIRSVQIGDHHAVIIDNFLEQPEKLRDMAVTSQFEPYPKFEERKGYPGIRSRAPEGYTNPVTALLESVVRVNFNIPAHLPLRKSMCAYSLTTMLPTELGPLQCTPHFDASTPYHMAVLLYLCGEEHGGTGFYRHNATGLQRITEQNREHYLDVYYEEINARRPAQRYFDQSDQQFTFLGMVPAKFNRLVMYHGSLLHTACVNPARSIDANPLTGRLTVNSFYDF